MQKSCRVCGSNLGQKYKYSKDRICEKLKAKFSIDTSLDEERVHPKYVCTSCYLKSDKERYVPENGDMFVWHEHTEDCDTCLMFKKRNLGGRKRKKNDRRGRPASKRDCATPKTTIASMQINKEIIPDGIVNTMPKMSRFPTINEGLICPICREVNITVI